MNARLTELLERLDLRRIPSGEARPYLSTDEGHELVDLVQELDGVAAGHKRDWHAERSACVAFLRKWADDPLDPTLPGPIVLRGAAEALKRGEHAVDVFSSELDDLDKSGGPS